MGIAIRAGAAITVGSAYPFGYWVSGAIDKIYGGVSPARLMRVVDLITNQFPGYP